MTHDLWKKTRQENVKETGMKKKREGRTHNLSQEKRATNGTDILNEDKKGEAFAEL